MHVGSLLAGIASYLGLIAMLALAMWGSGRATARLIGVRDFRWFRESTAPAWKLLLVRVGAACGPWAVSVVLFWAALVFEGTPAAASTKVEPMPGSPAAHAGLMTGDRVLAIGGKPVATWEQLRAAVPQIEEPVVIRFERGGRELELPVTPRRGKIGVSALNEIEHLSAAAAWGRALTVPWQTAGRYFDSLSRAASRERAEVTGSVGIMRQTSAAARSGWLLFFLAQVAAYLAVFLLGVPLMDAVTSLLFRSSHPAVDVELHAYRLERVRHALVPVFCANLALLFYALLSVMGGPPLAYVFAPFPFIAFAIAPLTWVGGRLVWKSGVVALLVGASSLFPGSILLLAIVLYRELGRAITQEGFDVSWWRMRARA